jgi:hypothetical protein
MNDIEEFGLDMGVIHSTIQKLLCDTFPRVTQKQHINELDNSYQFACPYCKDSETRVNEKRGNLYFDTLKYVCFNCGLRCYFDEMLKLFDLKIDVKQKLKIHKYLSSNKKAFRDLHSGKTDDFLRERFNELINLDDLIEKLNSDENINPLHDLKPLQKNSRQYIYLWKRGFREKHLKNIYQASYWLNEEHTRFEPVIVFLNRKNDSNEIIGMQTRNLEVGYKRRFKIYKYESCYKLLHGMNVDNDEEIPEHISVNKLVIYNKVSQIFNIFNISLYSVITAFEGYLDSLFFPNSIGCVGTETDLSFLEDNDMDLRYFYDNDDAGFRKAQEKIKRFPVFLWKKLIDELVNSNANQNKSVLLNKSNSILKDLNKLAEAFPNPYKTLNLDKYFSRDKYDIKYIPKPKRIEYYGKGKIPFKNTN